MKTWLENYNCQVCPYCDSKKIERVAIVDMGGCGGATLSCSYVVATGWLCANCKRYHSYDECKDKIDRRKMRRDMLRLRKFLEG